MIDVVIEPQRKALIPGFDAVKDAALTHGSLGCSISGGGPTMFAWCEEAQAPPVRDAMVRAFSSHGVESDAWIVRIENTGARLT
jgi:homoserine kinase